MATAASQGLANVLDPDYSPSTPSEQALFDLLQDHTFAVFTLHLRETEASEIVRKYSGKGVDESKRHNAQLLYQELLVTVEGGMAGTTRRTALEQSLQTLRLNSNSSKPIVSFLTTFSHVIQDLRELWSDDDTTSNDDAWCIRQLKTCLSTDTTMNQYVQTAEATDQTLAQRLTAAGVSSASIAQSYHDYFNTIKAYATTLDAAHKPSRLQVHTARGGRGGGGRGTGRGTGGRGPRRNHTGNGHDLQGIPDLTDPNIWLTN